MFMQRIQPLTGTFFCERTTAQSFPLTPTDVILAAVIALNAYSDGRSLSAMDLIDRHRVRGWRVQRGGKRIELDCLWENQPT
jgi:hypothetical protein